MTMLTVRGIDPEVKSKLRERAARHGRSMEAEVREILARAVDEPEVKRSFGQALVDTFHGVDVELPEFDRSGHFQRPVEL